MLTQWACGLTELYFDADDVHVIPTHRDEGGLLLIIIKSASFNVKDSCKLFFECVLHDGMKTCYLQALS